MERKYANMNIIQSTQEDIQTLEQIYADAFQANSRFFPDNMIEDEDDAELELSPKVAWLDQDKTILTFWLDDVIVGGAILTLSQHAYHTLDQLFISPQHHRQGLGYSAWCFIESTYAPCKGWVLRTPSCLMNNVRFYVDKCGFKIAAVEDIAADGIGMFLFIKDNN